MPVIRYLPLFACSLIGLITAGNRNHVDVEKSRSNHLFRNLAVANLIGLGECRQMGLLLTQTGLPWYKIAYYCGSVVSTYAG